MKKGCLVRQKYKAKKNAGDAAFTTNLVAHYDRATLTLGKLVIKRPCDVVVRGVITKSAFLCSVGLDAGGF